MSDVSLIPPHVPPASGKLPELDSNPAQKFRLGQILTAKVLRVYENGSYLVEMDGKQHVVDSAIPLRQGEVFKGKVLELGERAVLEKMTDEIGPTRARAELPLSLDWLDKNLADELKAFITRHQGAFDVRTWITLIRAANQSKFPLAVLSAAVFLHKLGMPITAQFAVELAHYVTGDRHMELPNQRDALYLETSVNLIDTAQQSTDAIPLIADYLKRKSDFAVEELREAANETASALASKEQYTKDAIRPIDSQQERSLQHALDQTVLQWLMNAQLDGSVTHRLIVVPFVLNGQLVELEMAVFDQHENADTPFQLKSKVIHLSLDMDHLGKLDVAIQSVNQNLKVHFLSGSELGLQSLAIHHQELRSQLELLDCRVDELRYDAAIESQCRGVISPIMNFVVNADSLSMLV